MECGPLRLKGSGNALGAGKGTKKAAKGKARILEHIVSSKKEEEEKRGLDKRTPALVAFEKMQKKRQVERVLKKALKTYKQRVEFNRHLDALPEYHDIPKVNWTK